MYGHIYHNIARPSPDLLAEFEGLPTATISDAMGRHGAMRSEIRPLFEGIQMVGSALTVLCFPGDNIMTHRALQMTQTGDVLVIDDGDHQTGCFGHRSALLLRNRGGVGAVMSGSTRDTAALRRDRIPIFCSGTSPRAPQKNTPGSINVPVHLGGIVVCPGDIIVGDDDGVVVVPLLMAHDVLAKAWSREHEERASTVAKPGEMPRDPSGAALDLVDLLEGRVIDHHEPAPWRSGSGSS